MSTGYDDPGPVGYDDGYGDEDGIWDDDIPDEDPSRYEEPPDDWWTTLTRRDEIRIRTRDAARAAASRIRSLIRPSCEQCGHDARADLGKSGGHWQCLHPGDCGRRQEPPF